MQHLLIWYFVLLSLEAAVWCRGSQLESRCWR